MQTRTLGNSDLKVSVVGLGTNNFGMRLDLEATRAVLHKAIDVGVTLIDTADVYGKTQSEIFIGEALGPRRKEVVLATKFAMRPPEPPSASRAYIMGAVEASLKRLKTDWIDLYQQHAFDASTPMDETLRALQDLIAQGKVRYIGNSNFSAEQIAMADELARELGVSRFISCQDEYSLAVREVEQDKLPQMRARQIGFLPFQPLASGLLTGKYHKGEPPPPGTRLSEARAGGRYFTPANLELMDRLDRFAKDRGHTLLELAFSWLLTEPALSSVIAGATSPAQIEANAKAAEWTLSPDEVAAVRAVLQGA